MIKEIIKIDIDQTVEIEEYHSVISIRIQYGQNYRDSPRYNQNYRNDFRRGNFRGNVRSNQNYRGKDYTGRYRGNY